MDGTNGIDYYDVTDQETPEPLVKAMQAPAPRRRQEHLVNTMLDTTPITDVVLPPELTPPLEPVEGFGVGQFYVLSDGTTGVLALGSFSGAGFDEMIQGLYDGLIELKSRGAERLIVDVVRSTSSSRYRRLSYV